MLTDIKITESQLKRLEDVKQRYKRLYQSPRDCEPMFIINVRRQNPPTWEQKLADPLVMLESQLKDIENHLAVEDDFLPAVRVNFGTAQIASAFGCQIVYPENNLPAAGSHPVKSINQIYELTKPFLNDGLYDRLFEWLDIWKRHLPEWIQIQHPDIQSPFNNAHLIRGNDILLDFYDSSGAVEYLLDVITDYMIDVISIINKIIGAEEGWFCDWNGAYWRGAARLSNCSTDMISPQFYRDFVLPRDIRFFESVGGGRMHYCGGHKAVIKEFFKNPGITGLDIDAGLHDLWEIAEIAPENLVLVFQYYGKPFPQLERLLKGDYPDKKNIVVYTEVDTIEQGRQLLGQLRESVKRL